MSCEEKALFYIQHKNITSVHARQRMGSMVYKMFTRNMKYLTNLISVRGPNRIFRFYKHQYAGNRDELLGL